MSVVTLDPSFGTSGQTRTDLALPTRDIATAAETLPNNDIIVAGSAQGGTSTGFLIAYTPSGTLDPSFGSDGIVQFPDSLNPSQAYALQTETVNGQEKLLVGLVCKPSVNQPQDVGVLRYNTDGTLDTTFGNAGLAVSSLGPAPDSGGGSPSRTALAVQADGKIVETGLTHGSSDDMAVTRFNADGSSDTSFGNGGIASIDFAGNQDYATGVGVDSTGRVVVGGYGFPSNSSNSDFEAARLNPDGTLDTSFGAGGKVHTDIAGLGLYDEATSLLVSPDNTVILGGFALVGTVPSQQRDFALVKYNVDGSLNSAFGNGGIVTTDIEGQGAGDSSILAGLAFQGSKIVAAGTQFGGGGVVRYNADGSLDTTFNGTGEYGANQPNYVSIDDRIIQPVATADGGVAIVGTVFNSSSNFNSAVVGSWDVICQKFTANGTVDTSFASSSEAITGLTGPSNDAGQTVSTMLPGGKILVAGTAKGWNTNSFLARYNADGTPDTTFGSGGIVPILASTAAGEGAVSSVNMVFSLQTQTVGSQTYLLLGGVFDTDGSDNQVGVMRFNLDGTPDLTFGSGGFATNPNILPYPGGFLLGEGLAIQSDGKILETGETNHGSNDMAVARFNADGSPDASFGSGGAASVDFGGNNDYATCVGVDGSGRIVLGGYSISSSTGADFALARLTSTGNLDTAFGTAGKTTTDFAGADDRPRAMLIDSSGAILLGGTAHLSNDDFALARYTAAGVLDSSFGSGGKVTTDLGVDEDLMGLTFQGSQVLGVGEKIQPGGSSTSGAVVRYNADGSLDTSFNGNGEFIFRQPNFNYSFNAAAITADNKIVLTGSQYSDATDVQQALVARLMVPTNPTVTLNPTAAVILGSTLTLTGSFADPGATSWTATVNFGDGTGDQALTLNADKTFQASHVFAQVGNYTATITIHNDSGGSGAATQTLQVIDENIQGMVWVDFNNDGNVDFGEQGIAGVGITLTNSAGQVVAQTTTDANGLYTFDHVQPDTYTITEGADPAGYAEGKDSLGTITDLSGNVISVGAGNSSIQDVFSSVPVAADQNAINYNFGEQPAPGSAVSKGQAAGIGFWQNKNGQALILKFTSIGSWLAATLPQTFGGMANASPQQVALLYQQEFVLKDKLDAQFMATALNVFATDQSLGGTAAAYYGFTIGQYGLGDSTWNIGSDGAAFNVSNNSTLTVLEILQDWDQQLNKSSTSLRKLALDAFGGINGKGGL